MLEEEFGKGAIESMFESVEQTPIASASLAQVHRGIMKNGEEVAIKVGRVLSPCQL